MAENPFQSYGDVQNTGMTHEYQALRMMNMADRMQRADIPRTHFAGGGRGGLGQNPMLSQMLGQQAGAPDYSQFTYDPAARQAAQQYLGQFGLSPIAPKDVNPNAFLPNTGFFGRHPRLAGGLEGALFGAAATRGSDTIGEGISNVAGGLLEGRLARQGMINRQFEKPFQAASMMEGMQDRAQERELRKHTIDLQDSEIQRNRALAQKAGLPEHDYAPLPGTGSTKDRKIGLYNKSDATDIQFVDNPNFDPKATVTKESPWESYQAAHPEQSVDDQLQSFHKLIQPPLRQEPLRMGVISGGKFISLKEGQDIPAGAVPKDKWDKLSPGQQEQVGQLHTQIKALQNPKAIADEVSAVRTDQAWRQAHPNPSYGQLQAEARTRVQQRVKALGDQAQGIADSVGGANPMGAPAAGGPPQVRDYTQVK